MDKRQIEHYKDKAPSTNSFLLWTMMFFVIASLVWWWDSFLPDEQGYTTQDINAVSSLIDQADRPHFKTKAAAVLADLWGITDEDLTRTKPVRLW